MEKRKNAKGKLRMKIGFAITAYDKFEEAKLLIEIIRKEFIGNYPISFCSNHPDGEQFAKANCLDRYIQAREIPYWNGDIHNPDLMRDRLSIVLRSTDTVQKSCLNALEMDVDYIIHMHSDAWVLDETRLIELVNTMIHLNKKIAIRGGARFDCISPSQMLCMDDHFFLFEKKFCQENRIFDFSPEFFFPDRYNVHEILFLNILVKAGLHNIWYYRNTKQLQNYDQRELALNTVRPVSYDPYFHFLHVHRGSFPGKYGQKIQAKYLMEHHFSKSLYIQSFIEKNTKNLEQCMEKLFELERNLNRKLSFWGYSKEILDDREIITKQQLLKKTKIYTFISNRAKKTIKKLINNNKGGISNSKLLEEYHKFFSNSIDVKNLDEFYSNVLQIGENYDL